MYGMCHLVWDREVKEVKEQSEKHKMSWNLGGRRGGCSGKDLKVLTFKGIVRGKA